MTDLQLSPHFTLAEMTRSQMALRYGLDNTPCLIETEHLMRLCAEILEPMRGLLGVPIHIDSGFRSPMVNEAVGGTVFPLSAHCDGRAADCIPVGIGLREAFNKIRASHLPYDQIIIECDAWINISIPRDDDPPRRSALQATGGPVDNGGTRTAGEPVGGTGGPSAGRPARDDAYHRAGGVTWTIASTRLRLWATASWLGSR